MTAFRVAESELNELGARSGADFGAWQSDAVWWQSLPDWFRGAVMARADADVHSIHRFIAVGAIEQAAGSGALLTVAKAVVYRDFVDPVTYRRELRTIESTGSDHLLALWFAAQCGLGLRADNLSFARASLNSAWYHAEKSGDVFVDIFVGNAYGDYNVFVGDLDAAERGYRLVSRSPAVFGELVMRVFLATNIALLRLLDGNIDAARSLIAGVAQDVANCPTRVVDIYQWARGMCGSDEAGLPGIDRADLRRLLVSLLLRTDSDLRASPVSEVAELLYQARLDPVTKLPPDEVLRAMLGSNDRGDTATVLLVRVLEFGNVEAAVREPARSGIERIVARRLVGAVGTRGLVGRKRFDEFSVVLFGDDEADDVIAAIELAISAPIEIEGLTLSFRTRTAVARSQVGDVPEVVFARAASALGTGRAGSLLSSTLVADESEEERALEALTLIAELRRAVDEDEIRIEFQPIVDARTGRVVAAESLARWTSPLLGSVPPNRFIPALEASGLIVTASRQLIMRELADFRKIHAIDPEVILGVNVSAVEFQHNDFPDFIDRACAEAGFDHPLLTLEITESVLVELHHEAGRVLEQLREREYRLVLDDFGTGHSNLTYLVALPDVGLKIDGAFVSAASTNPRAATVCKSIISTAAELSVSLVAEHVETASEVAWLVELGCHLHQGWYYAPSVPIDRLAELVSSPPAYWRAGGSDSGRR